MQMFKQMKQDVKLLFMDVEQVSLTMDAWTTENGTRILGITYIGLTQNGTTVSEFSAFKNYL